MKKNRAIKGQSRAGKRTTFYFPAEAATQLHSIMRRSRLDNGADVIRAALSAYDELLEVTEARGSIAIQDRAGHEWLYSPHFPCSYPGLSNIASEADSPNGEEKVPKNFVFSAEAAAKLDCIKSRSRFGSNADVIRAALDTYDELIRVVMAGDHIVVRDEAGNEQFYTPYAPLVRLGLNLISDQERVQAGNSAPSRASKAERSPLQMQAAIPEEN